MTRRDILFSAEKMVCGNREQDYGSPENTFARIAQFWSAYLNYELCESDVAAMMALLKIARIASNCAKEDSWIDLAGYAACGGELSTNVAKSNEVALDGGLENA